MSINEIVMQLKNTPGCNCYEALPIDTLRECESKLGFRFPEEYAEFLSLTNGCEAYFGHYRIFGFDAERAIDVLRWNQQDYWKFAWDGGPDDYWCFGETGFGDQYAFAFSDLRRADNAPVYKLHHISMTSDGLWESSFLDYLERDFLRAAMQPYSSRTQRAFDTVGPLELADHVVLVPSLLLLGPADDGAQSAVQTMPARAAMICNGDLGVQWDAGCDQGKRLERIEPFLDDQRRMRLRIVWGDKDGTVQSQSQP